MMTRAEYCNARDHIICAVGIIHPEARADLEELCQQMEAEENPETYEKNLQHLVGRLYDGLAYGNWPDVIAKLCSSAYQPYPRRG